MFRLLIYSLCTLYSLSLSAQRKVHVIDATTLLPIENVVVTDAQLGKVWGLLSKTASFSPLLSSKS